MSRGISCVQKNKHFQQRILPGHLALWWPKARQQEQMGPIAGKFEFERCAGISALMPAERTCRCELRVSWSSRELWSTWSDWRTRSISVFPKRHWLEESIKVVKDPNWIFPGDWGDDFFWGGRQDQGFCKWNFLPGFGTFFPGFFIADFNPLFSLFQFSGPLFTLPVRGSVVPKMKITVKTGTDHTT